MILDRKHSGLALRLKVTFFLILSIVLSQLHVGSDPFGARDFIAFWSGGRTFLEGANPYDDTSLRVVEAKNSWVPEQHVRVPQQFFNPPWSIPFFLPLSAIPFSYATTLWVVINIFAWIGIARLLAEFFKNDKKLIYLGTVVYIYAFYALMMGQLSLVILFLLLWGIKKFESVGPTWSAALGTVGIMLKPHLFLPLFLWGLCRVGNKNYKILAAKSLIIFCALWGCAELMHPHITALWIFREGTPTQWVSSSPAAMVQKLIFNFTGIYSTLPLYLFPIIGAAAALKYSFYTHGTNLSEQLPWLLFVGVACAPYAFPYDFVLCLPLVIQMAVAFSSTQLRVLTLLFPALIGILIALLSNHLDAQVGFILTLGALFSIISGFLPSSRNVHF